MNKINYYLRNTKFVSDFYKIRKTNKYKIIVLTIIFLLFILLFLVLLFINPFNPKQTIITSTQKVIETNLLPLCVGIISGIALSTSGCAMQGITRNSLAGPTTLGFLPIATLGLFVVQILHLQTQTYLLYIFSFLFSLIALLINFLSMSNNQSNANNYKMILIGLVFGALITSVNAILASKFVSITESVKLWLGTTNITYFLGNFKWEKFIYSAPLIVISFFVVMINAKKLNIIESDPILAKSLGINLKKIYWIIGIASIILTIASINLIGSVVIIGIVMPHLARGLLNSKNYNLVIPVSSIMTSSILMIALYINNVYQFGLNLYAVIISTPIFLYLIFFRKKR